MSPREELLQLLGLHVDQCLSPDQCRRLSALLRDHPSLVDDYVDYMSLQGLLFWDVGAVSGNLTDAERPRPLGKTDQAVLVAQSDGAGERSTRFASGWLAVVAAGVAMIAGWMAVTNHEGTGISEVHEPPRPLDSAAPAVVAMDTPDDGLAGAAQAVDPTIKPLVLSHGIKDSMMASVSPPDSPAVRPERSEVLAANFTDAEVIDRIDALIDEVLQDNEVSASPRASDSEWVRRVYLTIAGRIPTLTETRHFMQAAPQRKHHELLTSVIESTETSANFAEVWTNLLVGRTPRRHVNREQLYEFLKTSFAANVPWIDTVGELITARGRNDRNGATNFLLAHLNNEATPATAVTARLFLGEQISCVQCHDHPFAKGVKQHDYWALNAFFKDTDRVSVPIADASTRGIREIPWQLVDKVREDRMTHFETRGGGMVGVLPKYDGKTLAADSTGNRRESLAQLLADDSNAKVARALVNRMWAHFFGYGFTAQIDDMGAHAAVSHPQLLEVLTEAFVKSEYDVRRLMSWIAGSAAWRRSSEMVATNANDRPDHGVTPLFSRVYVRRMTPEQVYESVRVAIRSSAGLDQETQNKPQGDDRQNHRRDWVQQFAHAYNTDENDESMVFDGSIAQAMVMMNDLEVTGAIHQATAALCSTSNRPVMPITRTIDQVALSVLNREPTAKESKVFRSHYLKLAQQTNPSTAMPVAVEDMMWAYLNSSEFVLVH